VVVVSNRLPATVATDKTGRPEVAAGGFLGALLDYDLVGFQVQGYLDNYIYSCRRLLGARWDGRSLSTGRRAQTVGVYPAGIDPEEFAPPSVRNCRACWS
jgi:hypothetical protein